MVATSSLFFSLFNISGARAEDRTRGCLTAARRATCGLHCSRFFYMLLIYSEVISLAVSIIKQTKNK